MEKYNYYKAVREDVKQYIIDNYSKDEIKDLINTREDSEEILYDRLFCEDSVTGNASGSYWFSIWKAEEALCHNLNLLGEAMEEFGCRFEKLKNGAEWADVTIRCYLLGLSINEVLDELEEEINDERKNQ